MRHFWISLALSSLLILAGCGSGQKAENEFMISGNVTGAEGLTLTLEVSTPDSLVVLERVVLDATGAFSFHHPGRGESIYRLSTPTPSAWYFVMDRDEAKLQANNLSQDSFSVEGSAKNKLMADFIRGFRSRYMRYLEAKSDERRAANSDPGGDHFIYEAKKDQAHISLNTYTRTFADTVSQPLLSLFACDQLEPEYNYFYLENKMRSLSTDPIAGKFVGPMYKKLDNISLNWLAGESWELESTALGNKPFSLAAQKGKYVLMYFWGSQCEASRQENKILAAMKQKYADKNLLFVGVSLDENLDQWRERIAQDSLQQFDYHINQGGGWNSQGFINFNIKTIPATYLIGPNGEKLTLMFRASELDVVLQRYMK